MICAFVSFISTVAALFVSNEIDRNRWALIAFEMEDYVSYNGPFNDDDLNYERSFLQIVKIKMKIIKYNLNEVMSLKFHAFLLIQGLFMPKFFDFGYLFAIKVQHISKFEIGICTLASSLMLVFLPFMFNKFLA